MPVWAMAAAAPIVRIAFFGLTADSRTPAAAARGGLKASTARIHLGSSARCPSFGRPRHRRSATPSRSTPRTSLRMLTQVAGLACSLASAPPEARRTIVPSTASPTSQPTRNAGPLILARGVPSISTTATMGIGLSATPTPKERTSPIAWPMPETLLRLLAGQLARRFGQDLGLLGLELGVVQDAGFAQLAEAFQPRELGVVAGARGRPVAGARSVASR